jgi:hypothetical protein
VTQRDAVDGKRRHGLNHPVALPRIHSLSTIHLLLLRCVRPPPCFNEKQLCDRTSVENSGADALLWRRGEVLGVIT